MTPILKVITDYCEQYVDDEILSGLKETSAPLYFRKMWGIFNAAIPYFNMPPEMPEYLMGTSDNPQLTEPNYDAYIYTTAESHTTPLTIELGEGYKGFELFSCRIKTVTPTQRVIYTTADATYDPFTGNVTIPADEQNPISAGTVFDLDFYTDGYFERDLTPQQMMILGFCFELMWNIRFAENWLDRKPKIEDKSFSIQNIANKQNSDTARIEEIRKRLAREMQKYEQNCWYTQIMPNGLSRLV